MKVWRLLPAIVLIAVACGRGLPSSTSLGGILDDESGEARSPDRRAKSGGSEGASESPAEAKVEDAGAPPDASVTAKAEPADGGSGAPAESDASTAANWAGEYVGNDLTTTRLQGMPDRVQPDDKARTRVEEPGSGRVTLIVVDSSNGNPLCTLNAEAHGTTATIAADQSCFGAEEMTATVVEGNASLQGDRLVFDIEIALEIDAGEVEMTGSISYHFDGKRR